MCRTCRWFRYPWRRALFVRHISKQAMRPGKRLADSWAVAVTSRLCPASVKSLSSNASRVLRQMRSVAVKFRRVVQKLQVVRGVRCTWTPLSSEAVEADGFTVFLWWLIRSRNGLRLFPSNAMMQQVWRPPFCQFAYGGARQVSFVATTARNSETHWHMRCLKHLVWSCSTEQFDIRSRRGQWKDSTRRCWPSLGRRWTEQMIGRTPWICFSSITGYARTAQRKSVRWEPCMAGNRMCWLRVGRKCSRRVFGWIVWSAERPRFVITWRSNCPRWIGSRTATSARTLKATLFYCASPSVDKRGRLRTKLAGWWAASSRRLL